MASQSLYRKYRPGFFRELRGQQHISSALRNAIKEDRVGHAYLFSGPRGTGKTTTARLVAKALNCLNLADDGEPCGECENCVAVAAGNFADLIELDAASNNGVQAVRDLIEKVHFGLSATGKRKVYVIDEVHMLSSGASNALLKTLEEPPPHVVFVLATTDQHKVLPTIRSRTQHFEFSLLSNDELRDHLNDIAKREGIEIDAEAIEVVVRQGAGSARDAMSKLDMALAVGVEGDSKHLDTASVVAAFGGTGFDRRVAVLQAIADDDAAGALMAVTDALTSGTDPRTLAEELLATARDAFVLAAGGGKVPHSGPKEETDRLTALAQEAGLARCTKTIETLGDAIADMRGQGAPDPRLVLEVAVVRLARRETHGDIDGLMERIGQLEMKVQQLAGAATNRGSMPDVPVETSESSPGGSRPALGAFRREQRPPSVDPSPPAPDPVPQETPSPSEPDIAQRATPIEFDDVVLAWNATLTGLNPATRSMVQQAQPIAFNGDVVTFGIPVDQFTAIGTRFKNSADEIRAELKRHLGARVSFKLEKHDFEAPGALNAKSGGGAIDVTPPEELPDIVDLDELIDAPDAPARMDTQDLLMAEFGAHVVEERPRSES